MTTTLEQIVLDSSLPVPQRSERIVAALAIEPDRGLARASQALAAADDDRVAHYLSEYLALVPAGAAEKTFAAERLRVAGTLVAAASRLVPWLPVPLVDVFVADYLGAPDPRSPLFSVIYGIACHFPDRLRPHRERLDHPVLADGMLSGAPDAWVDELRDRYLLEQDERDAEAIARVRTPYAADQLMSLRGLLGGGERWEVLLAMAGRLVDGRPATVGPPYRALVVEEGASPHSAGGRMAGRVPACPICMVPAERLLQFDPASLPFGWRNAPGFFWYACACQALDFATVQLSASGNNKVFFGPDGPGGAGGTLVPKAGAVLLEPHANPAGVSVDAVGGVSQHQIGGPPTWIVPAAPPRCPVCSRRMQFAAQLDSGLSLVGRFGFTGVLYGFWCDDCSVSTTVRQA